MADRAIVYVLIAPVPWNTTRLSAPLAPLGTMAGPNGSVAFLLVFATRKAAEAASPGFEVLELSVSAEWLAKAQEVPRA